MTQKPATRSLRLGAAACLCLVAPTGALGQNALGDGHTLDRSLQLGAGGRNAPGPDLLQQMRLNNAVITGNAPDGRSFHGFVGYLAPDEFRAALGSNDLFRFRRDAFSSELAAQGIRGTDALRYQFSLTTGQSPPPIVAQQDFSYVARSGAAGGTLSSALRSTADYLAQQSTRTAVVGYRASQNGANYAVTASPLLGVGVVELTPPNSTAKPPVLAPNLTTPVAPGTTPATTPGEPVVNPQTPAGADNAGPGGLSGVESGARGVINPLTFSKAIDRAAARTNVDTRVDLPAAIADPLRANLEPGDLNPRVKTKPEETTPGAPPEGTTKAAWESDLDRLRRALSGQPDTGTGPKLPTPGAPAGPPGVPAGPEKPSATPGAPGGPPDPTLADVDPRVLSAIQRTRPTLTRLVGAERQQTTQAATYRSHMDAGQDLLAKGRYFDAEDRFLRALATVPRDPMAGIGRVHAQLGAGLYLSAATNLRTIFVDHPEIVGVHYDAGLLPGPDRMDTLTRQLRESAKAKGTGLGRDAALLLAYLGYQRRDPQMTQEGLDALAEWVEQGDAPAKALLSLLRRVWIEGEREHRVETATPGTPQPPEKSPDQNK